MKLEIFGLLGVSRGPEIGHVPCFYLRLTIPDSSYTENTENTRALKVSQQFLDWQGVLLLTYMALEQITNKERNLIRVLTSNMNKVGIGINLFAVSAMFPMSMVRVELPNETISDDVTNTKAENEFRFIRNAAVVSPVIPVVNNTIALEELKEKAHEIRSSNNEYN
jgi:hypothetical protein